MEAQAVVRNDNQKFCWQCGELIFMAAEICPECGVRQFPPNALAAPNGKGKVPAALFAFFLGGFGAHKFYLGS